MAMHHGSTSTCRFKRRVCNLLWRDWNGWMFRGNQYWATGRLETDEDGANGQFTLLEKSSNHDWAMGGMAVGGAVALKTLKKITE